jgi:CheY-like chemotaxis protein
MPTSRTGQPSGARSGSGIFSDLGHLADVLDHRFAIALAWGERLLAPEIVWGLSVVTNSPYPEGPAGQTVLVVDDEDSVRETVRRVLVRFGYTVLFAADAELAMSIISEHQPKIDLLLTDVMMPGRSGKELSVWVLERCPTAKVLFMSGSGHDVIAPYGLLEEGVDLIEKPFAIDDLLLRVRSILDHDS